MDWTSRRITAVLENALREDSATRDATTYACIDAEQRATATILAGSPLRLCQACMPPI